MTSSQDWGTQVAPLGSVHTPPAQTKRTQPLTQQQAQAYWTAFTDEMLAQVLLAVAGVIGPAAASFLGLTQWAAALQQAAQDALNAANGAQTTATSALNNWNTFLSSIGLTPTDIAGLAAWWNGLMGWLSGTSTTPALTGSVAAPAVTNTPHSAQPVPNFPNAASLVGVSHNGGGWAWDSSVSFAGSAGSAKCTANGALQAQNGVVTKVQPGQTVALGPEVQWAGLSALSGTSPIQVLLVPWSGTSTPGTAGTPILLAEITSPGASAASWTGLTPVTNLGAGVLSGVYTVPAMGVGFVQARIVVTADATAGSVWWNACDTVISGGYIATIDAGLTRLQDDATAATAATQTFLNAIKTANTADAGNIPKWLTDVADAYKVWAATESGIAQDELATLGDILQAGLGFDPLAGLFPPTQVGGVGGLATIEATLETWITQFSTSIGNALSIDITALENLPGVAQLLNALGITSAAAHTLSADTANTVAYVNNRTIMGGLDDTAEANMPYLSATTAISLLAPTSRIAFVRCQQVDAKGSISFTAEQSGGTPPTGMHVNLFKVDFVNQQLVPVATTAFVTAQLTLATEAMLFADAGQTPVVAGDVLGIEWQSTDTTHGLTLFGQAVSKPTHPVAKLPAFGATRNAGTTAPTVPVPFSDLTWSNDNLPYAGLETTTPPAPIFFPQQSAYMADATHMPAAWAVFVDLAIVGNAGGGEGETGAGNGDGGLGGHWVLLTLTVGATGANGIKAGTGVTFTGIGDVGSGGPFFTPGGNGGPIVASWVDAASAAQSVTVSGGAGGQPSTNLTSWGLAPIPQSQTFEGYLYPAGATNVIGGVGNSPGAGGCGGAAFQFGFAGASGRAWAVDRQT